MLVHCEWTGSSAVCGRTLSCGVAFSQLGTDSRQAHKHKFKVAAIEGSLNKPLVGRADACNVMFYNFIMVIGETSVTNPLVGTATQYL